MDLHPCKSRTKSSNDWLLQVYLAYSTGKMELTTFPAPGSAPTSQGSHHHNRVFTSLSLPIQRNSYFSPEYVKTPHSQLKDKRSDKANCSAENFLLEERCNGSKCSSTGKNKGIKHIYLLTYRVCLGQRTRLNPLQY